MSLDIWLEVNETIVREQKIYVRRDGQTVGITVDEWNALNPDRKIEQPPPEEKTNSVWDYNITHNLTGMAIEANVYEFTWDCLEQGHQFAFQVIEGLEAGIKELESKPDYYKAFNPENGWGSYDGLLAFLHSFLEACKQYPHAKIRVWR